MGTQAFNEMFVEDFSRPHPVPRAIEILREWMGTDNMALDVGCGSGFYTHICEQLGNTVFGIDITSQVATAHRLSLEVCYGNAEGFLPFPNDNFSLVLGIEVIEHLLQPDLMLSEMRRVLKPGGTLIVTTPNYAHWVLRILYLFGYPPVGLPLRQYSGLMRRVPAPNHPAWREPHIRFFTPRTLRQLLTQSGFKVESMRSSFVAFPSGLAPYLPWIMGLPLRVAGKLIGNLNFLGDKYPSLLAAGMLVKAVRVL